MKTQPPSSSNAGSHGRFLGVAALNLAATIQLVWFYLSVVPCYLNLPKYEQGLEKTPFQHRILLMLPLRWAHHSPALQHLAHYLALQPAWFPGGVRPEGILQAVVDLAALIISGLVARSIYQAASPHRLLTPFVYPLTLVMVLCTDVLSTMHRLRFIYDLPSLGFFAIGLYLIYFRRSVMLFAALFILATINRETTLFLLFLFVLAEIASAPAPRWRILLTPRPWAVVLPLSLFWIAWHHWILHRFAGNPSVATSRVWVNVGILLWPYSWAQLLGTFAFLGPVVFLERRLVQDPTLRLWLWILPLWLLFMFRYGVFIETRIFGELIPYLACCAVLIAEQHITRLLARPTQQVSQADPRSAPLPVRSDPQAVQGRS